MYRSEKIYCKLYYIFLTITILNCIKPYGYNGTLWKVKDLIMFLKNIILNIPVFEFFFKYILCLKNI